MSQPDLTSPAVESTRRAGRREWVGLGLLALPAVLVSMDMTVLLLGVAGATLAPSTLALIRNMFRDPRQRTTAISMWFMSFLTGAAVGPLVGGALLEYFWWGSAFLIGVPVMALLLAAGPFLLPEYRDPTAGRLDLASAAMSLAAVLAVIYGLKQVAADGLALPPVLVIAAGVAIAVVFVRRQRTLSDPLLDLTLLGERTFSVSLGVLTLSAAVMGGVGYLTAQYLQLPWLGPPRPAHPRRVPDAVLG